MKKLLIVLALALSPCMARANLFGGFTTVVDPSTHTTAAGTSFLGMSTTSVNFGGFSGVQTYEFIAWGVATSTTQFVEAFVGSSSTTFVAPTSVNGTYNWVLRAVVTRNGSNSQTAVFDFAAAYPSNSGGNVHAVRVLQPAESESAAIPIVVGCNTATGLGSCSQYESIIRAPN